MQYMLQASIEMLRVRSRKMVTLDDVLESHAHQIATYGGAGGIHDLGLPESAVLQPSAMFAGSYLHTDFTFLSRSRWATWDFDDLASRCYIRGADSRRN
jgi:hypothetical protein